MEKSISKEKIAYENGNNIVLYTAWVEDRLNLTIITKDKLTWLLDNEPMTYAEQALDGTLQEYLNRYEKRFDDCEGGVRQSFEKHYSPEIALCYPFF